MAKGDFVLVDEGNSEFDEAETQQWGREVLGYNLLQILSTNYRGQTQVTLSSSSMSGAPLKFLQEQIMQA